MAIEIVSFPIKNGDFPSFFVTFTRGYPMKQALFLSMIPATWLFFHQVILHFPTPKWIKWVVFKAICCPLLDLVKKVDLPVNSSFHGLSSLKVALLMVVLRHVPRIFVSILSYIPIKLPSVNHLPLQHDPVETSSSPFEALHGHERICTAAQADLGDKTHAMMGYNIYIYIS